MKKILSSLSLVLLLAGVDTFAQAAPVPGIYDFANLEGGFVILDPNQDGPSIGDLLFARDTSPESENGNSWYWGIQNLERNLFETGSIQSDGTKFIHTTRINGEFIIKGDHLWNQAPATAYTANIQSETFGASHFHRDIYTDDWTWDYFDGSVYMWGGFNEPNQLYTLDLQADIYLDYKGWSETLQQYIMKGDLSNVAIQISTPIPGGVWLLGSGLFCLAGLIPKKRKK